MRSTIQSSLKRGFTLIEILIVVVILGILAAIVIPQFTNASEDAQTSSVQSQLQTVRSQVELFNIQNPSVGYPDFVGSGWDEMTDPTLNPAGVRYLQQEPRNAKRDNAVVIMTGTDAVGTVIAAPMAGGGDTNGWYWHTTDQVMFAIDELGAIYAW